MTSRAEANRSLATHGHAARGQLTRTYKAWRYMRDRVARDPDYLGVPIAPRWDDYTLFLMDMGECPPGMTLDRVSNTRGYEKDNCRWATPLQQANNKTSSRLVEFDGRVLTLAEWARALGINYKTLHNRIEACGWSVYRAFTTPCRSWSKGRSRSKLDL